MKELSKLHNDKVVGEKLRQMIRVMVADGSNLSDLKLGDCPLHVSDLSRRRAVPVNDSADVPAATAAFYDAIKVVQAEMKSGA